MFNSHCVSINEYMLKIFFFLLRFDQILSYGLPLRRLRRYAHWTHHNR
jgi:hypothetical protein